jgi:pyruvate,water dikinase
VTPRGAVPAFIASLERPEAVTPALAGPKAARLAELRRAGLTVPDGFCLTADAYRAVLDAAGIAEAARRAAQAERPEARRLALAVRLGLQRAALPAAITGPLVNAWRSLAGAARAPVAVRSSALLEDTPETSFAGQFETYLGVDGTADLLTAVRACWASLWAARALRYMRSHEVDPGATAMAVLVQRLVPARASGGALSRTPEGRMLVTGTWGLGSAIAQGEVVPDRFVLDREGRLLGVEPGRKDRLVRVVPGAGPRPQAVTPGLVRAPCLAQAEAVALGRLVLAAEAALDTPVEVEWALGPTGPQLLQARPLRTAPAAVPDELWLRHPGLTGQPAGIGWGEGPACIVDHEHDLGRVRLGDVLVTQVAGPALTAVLPRVAGVVAELGGSTSHLAALARERGIPAVLGVPEATKRIPEGALVAVDGVTGVVRWMS